MATPDQKLLEEIAKKLNPLKCICNNSTSLGSAVVESYQPVDCNGDPVGPPISAMATISIAKQDVTVCNTVALAQAIADAINMGSADLFNIPTIEVATTDWNLSDNNDITKVHSISFSVTSGTVDLSINGGTAVTLPTGFNDGWPATTVFGVDFTLTDFSMGANVIISTIQKA